LIKGFFPKTAYEREALVKSFLLFFLTVELFLGVIAYLGYRSDVVDLNNSLFLEMKNYSYTFEGEKFHLSVVPLREEDRFYELFESAEGLGILIPVPGTDKDALKIYYPWDRYRQDVKNIKIKNLVFFIASSFPALVLSLFFSLYSLAPLRNALRIIEDVTRDIIHDLNTPLMSLMVNLKMLKSKYSDEEIERAELALKQLHRLRDNLRPLTAKTELKLGEVNLKKVLAEELEDLRRIYPEIRVEASLENRLLKTDESAFRRIVENLLSNAFKHNLEGGWVRVELRDGYLRIENSSPPLRNPQRVFERYYRESQRGLGLGLSIVRKLCEELGWSVKVSYRKGVFTAVVSFKGK